MNNKGTFLVFAMMVFINAMFALNDGPYVFIGDNNDFEVYNIEDNNVITTYTDNEVLLPFINKSVTVYENYSNQKQYFTEPDSIAVVSDAHGQFNLLAHLLRNAGVIDDNYNWNFNDNTLVITGDVFDRGPEVNECLWMIYYLQQEATKVGGEVILTLGNHEFLVMHKDNRYFHEKYLESEKIIGKKYFELYNEETVMGRWLRSCNTIVKVDSTMFVHGGISTALMGFSIEEINSGMRSVLSSDLEKETEFQKFLLSKNGPVWYRGFFPDVDNYIKMDNDHLDKILDFYDAKRIVVGHTTYKTIVNHFNGRILGVDAGLKFGKQTEGGILILTNDSFFAKKMDGTVYRPKNGGA